VISLLMLIVFVVANLLVNLQRCLTFVLFSVSVVSTIPSILWVPPSFVLCPAVAGAQHKIRGHLKNFTAPDFGPPQLQIRVGA